MKQFLNSGNFSEKIKKLPIDRVWRTIYTITLTNVKKGDIIVVGGQMEMTNGTGQNVGMAQRAVYYDPFLLRNVEITEGCGENITPNMHHGSRTLSGSFESPSDFDTLKLIWEARAVASRTSSFLTVEQDYGRLWAINFGPVTV